MRSIFRFVCVALLFGTVGCTHYEYDILRPANLAQHVGEKKSVRFQLDSLDYDFISYEDRLVIRISNPGEDLIRLVGNRSYVVDPYGQSHPLHGQTIAPGSYIKLILPPLRRRIDAWGPRYGFGVGVYSGGPPGRYYYGGYRRGFYDDAFVYDGPGYYAIYDGSEMYWRWQDETDIRLSLYYQPVTELAPQTQPAPDTQAAPTSRPFPTTEPVEPEDANVRPMIHTFDLHRHKM